jgi:hypothetical protein
MAHNVGRGPRPVVWDGADYGRRIVRREPPAAHGDGSGYYEIPEGGTTRDAVIYLRPDLPLDHLRVAAQHELGHSYGLEHHAGEGVMGMVMVEEWNDADEAECRRVGVCR